MKRLFGIMAALLAANAIFGLAHAETLGQGIKKIPEFSTLAKAIEASGLQGVLDDSGKTWTIFAPTNAAFQKLPDGALEALLKPENKSKLQAVLKYHIVEGALLTAGSAAQFSKVKSLEGRDIALVVGGFSVNGAEVHGHDVLTDNGVIHAIDAVIFPK